MGLHAGVSLCSGHLLAAAAHLAGLVRCWLSPRLTDCQSFLHIPIL